MFSGDLVARPFAYAGLNFQFWHYPLDPSAKGSVIEIVVRDDYRLSRFKDVSGAVFFDIGANNGLVSMILGKLNPGSRIIAVEPIAELCALLEHNLQANDVTNVEIIQKALHAKDELVTLHLARTCSGAASTHVSDVVEFGKVGSGELEPREVVGVTFDSLVSEYAPDGKLHLLKIDCEGGEYLLPESARFRSLSVDFIEGEFHETSYNDALAGGADLLFDICKNVVAKEISVTVLRLSTTSAHTSKLVFSAGDRT